MLTSMEKENGEKGVFMQLNHEILSVMFIAYKCESSHCYLGGKISKGYIDTLKTLFQIIHLKFKQ